MRDDLIDIRYRQLLDSPGGCALLVIMAHNEISPKDAVKPETAVHLVPQAVGELNPWNPDHDQLVGRIRAAGQRYADLARALVADPGIERWWAPLDRDRQGWIEPEMRDDFPAPATFPALNHSPTRFEHYVQWPEHHVSTSTLVGEWTAQLAAITGTVSDWHMDYPARRKRVRISADARVCEIASADDWHALVARHGARTTPEMTPHPDSIDVPWGTNDGLVPDWGSIADVWDGVHITLWAFLTGTQVRVSSDAGWTEMWSRDGEETTWLRWVFDDVDAMPPVDPLPQGPAFPLPFDIRMPRQPGAWWGLLRPR